MTSRPPSVDGVPPPPARHYFPAFDGVRALLASFVVWHHAYLQVWPAYKPSPWPVVPALRPLTQGHFAVDGFIVLSGFVLGCPVVRDGGLGRGAWGFYLGRFWRIVPAYYAAILLSLLLLKTLIGEPTGTHWDLSTETRPGGVAAALLFVHDWFGRSAVNHSFWSISTEARIYLAFPLMVWLWGRIGLPATALLVAAAVGLLGFAAESCGDPRVGRLFDRGNTWYAILFIEGVVAATVATSPDPRWGRWRALPWWPLALAGAATLGVLRALPGHEAIFRRVALVDVAVGGSIAAGYIALAARPGRASRLLASPPLMILGAASYSLYLIHAPLLQLVHQYVIFPLKLDGPRQLLLLLLIGYPVSIAAALGFARLFERPFAHRAPRLSGKREVARPAAS